ncbi:hypothetical protein CKO31_20950 [Thiohalocapsa halophila]|uniref:Uncharacterized protein n=1 Tax=Thiohalocapsa halophila TaxID=69359 RepID=A0ABS1CNW1_9GAMM|nr:hypothetical protein [Thiohalocapsa halophila]
MPVNHRRWHTHTEAGAAQPPGHCPTFARWTDAELVDHARSLGVAEADERPARDELVRRLSTALSRKP